ncbi:hypothetical protein GQ457_01G055140 [Hibiscus cannabinus]
MVNSFVDLEAGAIKALQEKQPGKPPVYPVGPLVNIDPTGKLDGSDCLKWLDDQPHGSVLYVSFGSGGTLSYNQITELALGLEMSELRFLWVVRSPNDTVANATFFRVESQKDPFDFLPKGFLERTKGRGLVVPSWAPQAQVLRHESTGGFLTHCGWNSVLESVVNGVPLIAWPLYAEQRMNALMLTEDIKVAVRPKPDENGLVCRDEIAEAVKVLMEGEEGKGVRNRMKDLKEAGAKVLGDNGSSTNALSEVANKWKNQTDLGLNSGILNKELENSVSFSCNVSSGSVIELWHNRLGHPSKQRMSHFSELDSDIPSIGLHNCDTCLLAKHKRLPFPVSTSVSKSIFDLVHLDVWGPFPVKSFYGHSYFLTIVDDKSRFLWIYPMILKSEVRKLVAEFCVMVETHFSKKIKFIRTDNAKEFDLDIFFKERGIVHQNSCVYTPQQNSVVERKHQHLLNVARTLKIQANLPLIFWIDCILHAALLINMTPTPVLQNKTPFEVLFQKKPKITHLRVLGSLAYASVLPKPVTKLNSRAVKCVLIGYPKNIKGYRLFNLETQTIFVSRDVVFVENIFPFKQKDFKDVNHVLPMCENLSDAVDIFKVKSFKQNGSVTMPVNFGGSKRVVVGSSTLLPDDNSEGSTTVSQQPLVDMSQPNERPRRSCQLPQRFKDYQVDLPKVRTSPHAINQVLSFHNISSLHKSFVNSIDILKEPKSYKQAILHDCWKTAMSEEISALERNNTWELVPLPEGKQAIGCKWVYKTKLKSDGSLERYKARLVAKGYTQQPGIDYLSTFSPVAKLTTIRTLLAVAASKNWILEQLDVNNAFLHGYLDEEVYMKPPPGFSFDDSHLVCRLRKSLYGLKQASRQWNQRLTDALLQQGFKQAASDNSLFIKGQGDDFIALLIYIDDVGYRYPKPWYRYPLSRMAELAGKTSPTAPNKVQRSPTARITFGTIKQASKHQGKTNASLYNIIMMKNCLSA